MSATHYLTGCFFFLMFIFPVLYIFFNVPSLFMDPSIYLAVLIPYLLTSISLLLWTLRMRLYRPSYMLHSVLIGAVTFPVFVKAAFCTLFGIKGTFVVTPKNGAAPLYLKELWIQVGIILVCVAGVVWAGERIYFEREGISGMIGNMVWVLYNLAVICSVVYFNNPKGKSWRQELSSS